MKPSEITESHVDAMYAMYGKQLSHKAIAFKMGLTKSAVQRYMANRAKGIKILAKDAEESYQEEQIMQIHAQSKFTNNQLSEIFEAIGCGESIRDIAIRLGLDRDALRKRLDTARTNGFSASDDPGTHEIQMYKRQNAEMKARLLAETIKSSTTRELLGLRPDLVSKFMPFLDELDAFWIKSDAKSVIDWIDKLEAIKPPDVSRFYQNSRSA